MPDIPALKSARDDAKKTLDEARAALAANPDDAEAAKAASTATSKYYETSDAYTAALEETKGLEVNIEERLAAVRKEEKDKLYKQIEDSKSAVKSLEKDKEDLRKAAAEKEAEIEALRKAGETGDNKGKKDDNKESNGMTEEQVNALIEKNLAVEREKAQKTEKAYQSRVAELEKSIEQRDLNEYKQSRINEIGEGNLIASMIEGKTKEEIDDSIIRAQQEYQRVASSVEARLKGESDKSRDRVPTPPPPSGSSNPGDLTEEQISAMDPEQFAEFRKSAQGRALLGGRD